MRMAFVFQTLPGWDSKRRSSADPVTDKELGPLTIRTDLFKVKELVTSSLGLGWNRQQG